MKTICNNRVRPFIDFGDLSTAEQSNFDWLEDREDGFFRYLGTPYHIDQFTRIDGPYFHGGLPETAFSAVVVRLEGDGIIVGRQIY